MENKEKLSFSLQIKKEIMAKQLNKKQMLNLLSGIFDSFQNENNKIKITLLNKEIFDFISILLDLFNLEYSKVKKNVLEINLDNFKNENLKKERDYFGGIFLVSGSINDLKSSSNHLEMKFSLEKNAKAAIEILSHYGFDFKLLKRSNRYFIYIKKIEQICDFLKAIETIESYYLLEESKIRKDYYNNINRITNFDMYNQKRIANANVLFINAYQFLEKNLALLKNEFSKNELAFFKLKANNLDASLEELSSILKTKIINKSRSSLNNALIKLKRVYQKFNHEN
ncbi:DNA-binding protein WhiA [Mycoplasma struthionis]|uniref:Probable cell division protein WhiA n=1 Tax=Mycoplasma struthionis TaxID=538220 RepID=A0A502MJB9_9MOLU|nr:DNA-binding protein WhiA [Mycoplasma struthionis]TPI02643.1 DNA-binding protein WhiA [Mycoplasma struthionis]